MPTNDTPMEKQLRKAMDAIDAIAAMDDVPLPEQFRAFARVGNYARKHRDDVAVRFRAMNGEADDDDE